MGVPAIWRRCHKMNGIFVAALITLFYGGWVRINAESGSIASCIPGQRPQVTDVHTSQKLIIQCPNGLDPLTSATARMLDGGKSIVLLGPHAGNEVKRAAIGEFVPGALYVEVDNKYVLLLFQLPPTERLFYFHCQAPRGGKLPPQECYIGIRVHPPRLGPNVCEAQNSRIVFSVENRKEQVQFSCGPDMQLIPQARGKVYDARCQNQVDLFPGAALFLQSSSNKYNRLEVSKLPAHPTTLCYICAANQDDATKPDKRCECHINIKPSGGVPQSPTTTPTKPISAAVRLKARSALAVAAVLVALLLFR